MFVTSCSMCNRNELNRQDAKYAKISERGDSFAKDASHTDAVRLGMQTWRRAWRLLLRIHHRYCFEAGNDDKIKRLKMRASRVGDRQSQTVFAKPGDSLGSKEIG